MRAILTPTNRDTKSPVFAVDNVDDRREVRALLERLSPSRRVDFLRWACSQAKLGPAGWGLVPRVTAETLRLASLARWDSGANERLSVEVWRDVWQLCASYDLSLDSLLARLVQMARRP